MYSFFGSSALRANSYRALCILALASLLSLGSLNITAQKRSSLRSASLRSASLTQTVFSNSSAITIPAIGPGSLYPSPITVSGLSGNIPLTPGSIKVTINNFSHTFNQDVGIVLVSPTGAALLLQDYCGDDSEDNITYSLSDAGQTQLPFMGSWGPGTYKPTDFAGVDDFDLPGPSRSEYNSPGPVDGNSATFASTFGGTNPNGTWKLYVEDFVSPDGGSISGGWSLEINTGSAAHKQHVVDFDGDGKTDWVLVRNITGEPGGQLRWIINLTGTATTYTVDFGLDGDKFVPADYDGDTKTDIAVWRPGPPLEAAFYILQSGTNTVRTHAFGQTGDDPSIVGDYDGDGKADIAVYREGAAPGDQSWFYFLGTKNNPTDDQVTFVPWGIHGDFVAPGDYDGDGKYDFVIQRNIGGEAIFWRLLSSTGGNDVTYFGLPDDVIAPGDYDGDGKTDIAVVRSPPSSPNFQWFVLPSSTGVKSAAPAATFGLSSIDYIVQGDYDADGKTDFAIWRPSATPGGSVFWFLGSTVGAGAVPNGLLDDYPAANFNVH